MYNEVLCFRQKCCATVTEAAEYYKQRDSRNHRILDTRQLCYTQDTLKLFLKSIIAFEITPPWRYLMTKLQTFQMTMLELF